MRLTLRSFRAFPSSLFARMALILLAGLLAAQLASLWLQWGERATVVSQARGQNFTERMAEAIRVLEADEASRRSTTLAALQSGDLRVTLIRDDQVSPNPPRGQIQATLSARLGSEREIRSAGGGGGGGMQHMGPGGMQSRGNPMRSFDVRLRDGQWVRISAVHEADTPALPNELIAQLLITLFMVVAVVMIAVRQATRPLQKLANAADTLGSDLDAPPLTENGPTETTSRGASLQPHAGPDQAPGRRARTGPGSSVARSAHTAHPRLRLRAELVIDERLREQMAADLDSMAAMLDATLDYLRGLQDSEALRPIDMNALLQSLAEDAAVLGKNISVEGLALAPYSGRLSALRRALQNLIDNAIKYGHGAQLRIEDAADALRLIVEDAGPGIAPAELSRVSEPYYRPDASRSRATGGVGLGLSIVKDIALMHGGELLLANRPQGGLSATLVLPRVQTAIRR